MRRSLFSKSVVLSVVAAGATFSLFAGDAAARPSHVGMVPAPGISFETAPAMGAKVAAPTDCGVVTYCGGPVLSNVEVVPVFWTSGVSSTVKTWAPNYLKTIVDSPFMDMLSEYSTKGVTGQVCSYTDDGGVENFGPATPFSTNQTITRGTSLAAVTITPIKTTGTTINDDPAAIGQELEAQIAAGKLPAPTYDAQGYPNTFYVVFFPKSYSIQLQGMGSCTAFYGYHYSASYKAPATCVGQYLPYAVIPDCSAGTGTMAGTVSHELAEAVSDTDVGPTGPNPNQSDGAWYLGPSYPCNDPQSCPQDCGEIGDVCDSSGSATVPGTSIIAQNIWSQKQTGCDVQNTSLGKQSGPGGSPAMSCMLTPPPPPPPPPVDAGTGGGVDSGTTGGGVDSGTGGGPTGDDAGTTPPPSGGGNDAGTGGTGGTGNHPGRDAGTSGGGGDAGAGNGDNGGDLGSTSAGCAIGGGDASSGTMALGAIVGLALLARGRKSRRRSS